MKCVESSRRTLADLEHIRLMAVDIPWLNRAAETQQRKTGNRPARTCCTGAAEATARTACAEFIIHGSELPDSAISCRDEMSDFERTGGWFRASFIVSEGAFTLKIFSIEHTIFFGKIKFLRNVSGH